MKPHRLRACVVALLLACLAGCGPGVGGTGTGAAPDPSAFGAAPASVCAASFAGVLKCPVGAGAPGTASALTGTELVRFADLRAGGNVAADIDANTLHLEARCQALQFTGTWGVLPFGEGGFFGRYASAAGVDSAATTLVTTGNNAGELQMTLFNADGQAVLGPLTLQGVDAPVTHPAPCP